jgi:hypothetical protein
MINHNERITVLMEFEHNSNYAEKYVDTDKMRKPSIRRGITPQIAFVLLAFLAKFTLVVSIVTEVIDKEEAVGLASPPKAAPVGSAIPCKFCLRFY